MITYDYYRIFYFVARYKSFTKAAKMLGNNQPNITPVSYTHLRAHETGASWARRCV